MKRSTKRSKRTTKRSKRTTKRSKRTTKRSKRTTKRSKRTTKKIKVLFTLKDIHPPSEFMPESPFRCEGYWSSTINPEYNYYPKISTMKWANKDKFVKLVNEIEKTAVARTSNLNINHSFGYSISRIDKSDVGTSEYFDKINNMCWPSGYVKHYIEKYNVMPTKRFFDYITNFFAM